MCIPSFLPSSRTGGMNNAPGKRLAFFSTSRTTWRTCGLKVLTRSNCCPPPGINSVQNFTVNKAKQFVGCSYDGYVIGDAILFFLDKDELVLVGRPSIHNWVQYHAETDEYNVTLSRDERSIARDVPIVRRLYRYQVQGPNADQVLNKLNGSQIPEIKFFNMGEITIAGRKVRALRHGMAGAPGLELWGPHEEREEIRAAIVEAGEEFGLRQVGSRAYATNTLESGWIPSPMPAVYSGEKMKAYRQWLRAKATKRRLRSAAATTRTTSKTITSRLGISAMDSWSSSITTSQEKRRSKKSPRIRDARK